MAHTSKSLTSSIAPPRFLAFMIAAVIAMPLGAATIGWRAGTMAGFDFAAIVFLIACVSLLHDETNEMRKAAERNDANPFVLLGITGLVMVVVLVAVAAELTQQGSPKPAMIVMIVGTLVLSWLFSNMVYALHYAHMFYSQGDGDKAGKDCGGVKFPDTDEPDYWDFIYFAFCLGMTFQTSDVDISSGHFRKVVTAHCMAAFVFNLGVVAFTINVLGGG